MTKIYALYKGDKLLATGTIIQISHQLNIKPKSLKFYKTPTWIKRRKNKLDNCKILIEIEDN